jgi:hypothetical protein
MKQHDNQIHEFFMRGATFPDMAETLKLKGEHCIQQLQRYVSKDGATNGVDSLPEEPQIVPLGAEEAPQD